MKIHEIITESREDNFARWFGNSKIVDSSGKPLRVYHGTIADFSEFRGERHWFSSDPSYASDYSENVGHVMPLYIKCRKPKVFDYSHDGYMEWTRASSDRMLIRQGYDGVLFQKNDVTVTGYVFSPNQIKSATGNNGDFDSANPDITKE